MFGKPLGSQHFLIRGRARFRRAGRLITLLVRPVPRPLGPLAYVVVPSCAGQRVPEPPPRPAIAARTARNASAGDGRGVTPSADDDDDDDDDNASALARPRIHSPTTDQSSSTRACAGLSLSILPRPIVCFSERYSNSTPQRIAYSRAASASFSRVGSSTSVSRYSVPLRPPSTVISRRASGSSPARLRVLGPQPHQPVGELPHPIPQLRQQPHVRADGGSASTGASR